jgi:hypothetical protein
MASSPLLLPAPFVSKVRLIRLIAFPVSGLD